MKPLGSTKDGKKKIHVQRKKVKRKNVDLGVMSVDDFMQKGIDVSDQSEDEVNVDIRPNIAVKKKIKSYTDNGKSDSAPESINDGTELVNNKDGEVDDEDEKDEGDWTSANFSHKKALAKLQKTDPEFYRYLQENDKDLLDFNESDSEYEVNPDDVTEEKFHKPPDRLEVASDESDYEGENLTVDSRTITLKMVKEWEEKLRTTSVKSPKTIVEVMHAFHAATIRVSHDDNQLAKYVVSGSSVFNAIIQLCVLDLQPALKKYLKIRETKHFDPTKVQLQWSKLKNYIKSYMLHLVKLLKVVSSSEILAVMLKHLHQMIPFSESHTKLHRPILKILIVLWSTGEDTVRVVAFLCILRLTTRQQNDFLNNVLKKMYLAFIQNCKFMSPNTLPAINFMRRSLVEIFALDFNVSYQHTFLYIRQLAIHLRNAITVSKKENFQAVYNWQFVNSLRLWVDVLVTGVNKPILQPLIYPLVQVIIGTIKLISYRQYFPLRFHCTQLLIDLSKRTYTFIPILPFLVEVLNIYNFNQRHAKLSMKPVPFTFILHASKSTIQENGFTNTIISTIYRQMLEYLSFESSSISFPDLIIPAVLQIKKFNKICKVSNYCRQMKQLLDKILENAQVVEKERQKVNFKLTDQKAIAAWETQLKLKGTPLSLFYDNWNKINCMQEAKQITQNEKIGDINLPVLRKRSVEKKPKSDKSDGPVVLFPSDDSDSDVNLLKSDDQKNDENYEPMKKSRKRGNSSGVVRSKKPVNDVISTSERSKCSDIDAGDIVEDLKFEDLP